MQALYTIKLFSDPYGMNLSIFLEVHFVFRTVQPNVVIEELNYIL